MTASHVAPLLARAADLAKAGRSPEAAAQFRAAARLQPSDAAIQHDLAVACLQSGLLAEAAAAFQRAIAINPRLAKAYWRLGVVLELQDDPDQAIAAYLRAGEVQPSLTEAHFGAANLFELHGYADEAIANFRRAAASGPKAGLGRIAAARALLLEERLADAERVLRQALVLDATNAAAHEMLGTILSETGRFAEARACFQRAIDRDPLRAGSYYDLVRCRAIAPAEAGLMDRIEASLAEPALHPAQRLRVHLALGKVADDLGDYALAMRHFGQADAIRGSLAPFDIARFEAQVDWMIAHFRPELIDWAPEFGRDEPTPIIIVGMPRSGTTLVEQIVSAHPAVHGGGELNFWDHRGDQWPQAAARGQQAPFLADAAAGYLAALRAMAPRAERVTDKMPRNFIWAGLIHLAFPRATIIHCRRAPIDTALSIHQTYFNPRLSFPTGGEALVAYYRAYARLVAHWRSVLPADRFIDVDYGALTTRPEPTIRRLIDGCGLAWDDACLRPEANTRPVRTASKWQVRQPIHGRASQRWRHYEPWLGPLRALLGDATPEPGHQGDEGAVVVPG